MLALQNKKIYIASNPIDMRKSIDGLSELISENKGTHLHDGSVYVFYNKNKNKIKCLFWDINGFVLYYKRLDRTKFKFKKMINNLESVNAQDLEIILSGMKPQFA